MSQTYKRELDLTFSLFHRLRIPVRLAHTDTPLGSLDQALRQAIGAETVPFPTVGRKAEPKTVYKVADTFLCRYIYFLLPDTQTSISVVIGPYLTEDPDRQTVLKIAEAMELPVNTIPQLIEYYASLPVYQDTTALLAIVSVLGEVLWGDAAFDMVDVNYEPHIALPHTPSAAMPIEQESILRQMEQMEKRYAYENELMQIVAKGQTDRAEMLLANVSLLNYLPRDMDPLRNMKNYCIICNTLLRKAAQQGGVHPLHLDEISGRFARTIENMPTQQKCVTLIGDMIRTYCHLVRNNTVSRHSAPVQKALIYIDANLSGDLSLPTLAHLTEVSPSYLSSRFHREVGHTLAEHIADTRMKAAQHLLKTTQLQIQTVAQLCGFADPNYFGKQFRRYSGMTPLQYRKSHTNLSKL